MHYDTNYNKINVPLTFTAKLSAILSFPTSLISLDVTCLSHDTDVHATPTKTQSVLEILLTDSSSELIGSRFPYKAKKFNCAHTCNYMFVYMYANVFWCVMSLYENFRLGENNQSTENYFEYNAWFLTIIQCRPCKNDHLNF